MSDLEIGHVARAHGLRGEVRVALHWPDSSALFQAERVTLVGDGGAERVWSVEAARRAGKAILLKLAGVVTRDDADALRGCAVRVRRADVPPPEPGEYYLCDLIGAEVFVGADRLGVVLQIATHPSADSIVIETSEGDTVEQVLEPPWLDAVDAEGGRIVLSTRDGLIER